MAALAPGTDPRRARREETMDEERPAPPPDPFVGVDLSRLSVEEIHARIAALKGEIERLEAALAHKQASRAAADAAFKL